MSSSPAPHWSKVVEDLQNGDLTSLESHLREHRGHIDHCVARELIRMLSGRGHYVLNVKNKPGLAPNQHTKAEQWARIAERRKLALAVGAAGGGKRGFRPRAIKSVSENTKVNKHGRSAEWIRRELKNIDRLDELLSLGEQKAKALEAMVRDQKPVKNNLGLL